MREHFKEIANRIVDAEDAFVETLTRLGGIDEQTAEKVMTFYIKNRLAKLDMPSSRISVKHGAYLDADVIQRAAKLV